MKKVNQFFTSLLVVCTIVTGLTGCKEKIDLNNIDTRMKADMGLALPVGNMLFTANDFLGGGQVKNLYIDRGGVFHVVDTIKLDNGKFPLMDVSQYVDSVNDQFKLKRQLDSIVLPIFGPILDEDGNLQEFAKGLMIPVKFHKNIELKGINKYGIDKIRLDKAEVKTAQFSTIVGTFDLNDLLWNYIEEVDIIFNHQYEIKGGNTVAVYKKGDSKGGYGKDMPIHIDDFVINLMKDKQAQPGWNNVLDTVGLTFEFKFIVPKGQPLHLSDQSAFTLKFKSNKIDYSAIYGWFDSDEQVHARQVVSIDSILNGMSNIDSLLLKLTEPAIHLNIAHHQSIPMLATIDTFMTKSTGGDQRFATWNGVKYQSYHLDHVISPYSNPQDSAWNTIRTNQAPDSGHIDNLFTIRPDSLVFCFTTKTDASSAHYAEKQHRITDQTTIASNVVLDIPFKVNKESAIQYVDKIVDVDFSKLSIDSLLKETKVVEQGKAKSLKLYVLFSNSLPFMVDAKLWFLRKDSTEMDINIFAGQELNQITLPAPQMQAGNPYGKVVKPSESTIIIDVNEQHLDSLLKVKHLKIDAFMGDNPEPCMIDTATSITVNVGLATQVEAIINPNKK